MRRILLLTPAFLITNLLFAQQGKEPVKVTDLLEVRTAGNVTLTKDGKRMAYTVTSIISDEKNAGEYKYQGQVWIAQTTGSLAQQQFTTAAEGAGQPAFSPDGTQLAFVRAVDGNPQIFIVQMGGGEPVQLTKMPYGATGPVWSPNGNSIAFSSSIPLRVLVNDSVGNPSGEVPAWTLEKPGVSNTFLKNTTIKPNANGSLEEVRAYLLKNEQDKRAKVITKLNFQQEAATSSDISINHIFLLSPVAGAKPRQLTRGFISFSNPQFVPGSPFLMVEAPFYPAKHPDRSLERAIFTLDSTGRNLNLLLGDSGYVYGGASVSGTGKWLAYNKGKTGFVTVADLYVQSLENEKAEKVNIKYDRNKGNLTWSDDDRYLYFSSPSNGGVVLNRYDLPAKQLVRLTSFEEGISSFDVKAGVLAFSKNSVANPSEIFVSDAEAKNARQVSSLNAWVKDKKLVFPEKHSFKNEKGLEIEYWVMKPSNFETGKKYPLLLEIHGGPTAMWGPGEASMWHEFQYYCSKGYGIVYSNPRGSGGYGESFMRANINDWGNGPMRDVLTAVDKTVAEGWSDTSKLLVTGGSYAGYLIAYILGHDQRFAAACSQRGVYDLRTFFGEGNAWRLVPNYFGGYPWEKTTYNVLERESPITYVQNIKTPLIIFHGEQDLRTGVIQSEQLYKSLKVLGREVEYVRHPGATHELTRSGNNRQRIDQMLRTWEFFERFIGVR
jgi:dipeptidyl aminopeptidase/acylaminoacyl peptidase